MPDEQDDPSGADTRHQPGTDATTPKAGRSGPETDLLKLLKKRKKLAWASEQAYFERASVLNALNYLIGIPVVIVTALAGSAIVASHTTAKPVPLWVGVITVSAAVLASLQTFFRFGERSAFSAMAGNRYAKIHRHIEDALATEPGPSGDDELKKIEKLTDDAGEQSPPIGERRWLRWLGYSEWDLPPPKRAWWRALFGFAPANKGRDRSHRF